MSARRKSAVSPKPPRARAAHPKRSRFAGWDAEAAAGAAGPAAPDWSDLRAPSGWLLALESRAPLEYLALMAALPWMRQLPQGDGHPVMIFPGPSGANDTAPAAACALLDSLGYHTHPWGQGFNLTAHRRAGALREHDLRRLRQRFGCKPSPWAGARRPLRPRAGQGLLPDEWQRRDIWHALCRATRYTHAWRFFRAGQRPRTRTTRPCWTNCASRRPCPPPRSTLRSDGIVAWHCSVNEPGPLVENIEVHASHGPRIQPDGFVRFGRPPGPG